jgi:hypothetical protein
VVWKKKNNKIQNYSIIYLFLYLLLQGMTAMIVIMQNQSKHLSVC